MIYGPGLANCCYVSNKRKDEKGISVTPQKTASPLGVFCVDSILFSTMMKSARRQFES